MAAINLINLGIEIGLSVCKLLYSAVMVYQRKKERNLKMAIANLHVHISSYVFIV